MPSLEKVETKSSKPPVRRAPHWSWLMAGLALGAVALLLYQFNPAQHALYPRCMFYQMTGLQCPGCGGLRAAHQLLHGHWNAAFRLNPMLFLFLPVLFWYALRAAVRQATGRELPAIFNRRGWLWMLLVLVVLFGIVRNLSFGPFAWLKP